VQVSGAARYIRPRRIQAVGLIQTEQFKRLAAARVGTH
jgi:hypothetical protein